MPEGPAGRAEPGSRRPPRTLHVYRSPRAPVSVMCYNDAISMSNARIQIPDPLIRRFCRKHHIRRLALFGSALRDDFGENSDIDLIVEFEAGQVPGLFRLCAMERELTAFLGRKVDLRTPREISRYFCSSVCSGAETVYERT